MKKKKLDKNSDEFETPDEIFKALHDRYYFSVDAAASLRNKKLPRYWTKRDDALSKCWRGERIWCNPPYSKVPGTNKGFVDAFVRKAFEETAHGCKLAVLLVPTKTEQPWFHELRASGRVFIEYFKGRIRFKGGEGVARDSHMLITIWPPLDFLRG